MQSNKFVALSIKSINLNIYNRCSNGIIISVGKRIENKSNSHVGRHRGDLQRRARQHQLKVQQT